MVWLRIRADLIDDRVAQEMPAEEYRAAFMAAAAGEPSVLANFIRPGYSRPTIPDWADIRRAIFKRDNYTCLRCGLRGVRLECDHIIALVHGGESTEDNLQTLCLSCNRRKGAR